MQSKPSRREVTHERILEVASLALRRNGYSGVGVADVMKQAGLTHGGFYAHFPSRDALLAEAIARAGSDNTEGTLQRIASKKTGRKSALHVLVEDYLSETHLRDTEGGCVVAALSSEMSRQSPELRQAASERVRSLVNLVSHALPPDSTPDQAMAIAGSLVGSLQLARALGPNAQGKAMLAAARHALLAQYAPD